MEETDDIIKNIARGFEVGAALEDIHDSLVEEGYTEDQIFLLIKAGEQLHKALKEKEAELAKRPAPFGRRSDGT